MSESKKFDPGLRNFAQKCRQSDLFKLALSLEKRTGGSLEERYNTIEELGLPVEPIVDVSIGEFSINPDKYFAELSEKLDGYQPKEYFALLISGKVRAFGVSRDEVVKFINKQRKSFPDDFNFKLMNRDHAFTGSFDVDKEGQLTGNFVLGPYDWLAHSKSKGDLLFSEKYTGSPKFNFTGVMEYDEQSDFRNDDNEYKTYTGSNITKRQMAKSILAAREELRRAVDIERGKLYTWTLSSSIC